jgi:chorismate-pyruvate lyase
MIRPSPWPDLDRLARFVRASDSLTDTLATWTGRGLIVEILSRGDACPDPLVADSLSLHDGARVQERSVLMRSGDAVVATARASVAADSPALTPAIRTALRGGASLGDLLRPLHRRRVAVRVTVLRERPGGCSPTASRGSSAVSRRGSRARDRSCRASCSGPS